MLATAPLLLELPAQRNKIPVNGQEAQLPIPQDSTFVHIFPPLPVSMLLFQGTNGMERNNISLNIASVICTALVNRAQAMALSLSNDGSEEWI